MHLWRARFLVAVFLLATPTILGCSGRQDLKGYVHFAFELHAFQPCDSSELIWMNIFTNPPGWEKVDLALGPEPICGAPDGGTVRCTHKQAYVELTAVVSGGGGKGHLNKFAREMDIEQVHAAAPVGPSSCGQPTPKYPR